MNLEEGKEYQPLPRKVEKNQLSVMLVNLLINMQKLIMNKYGYGIVAIKNQMKQ